MPPVKVIFGLRLTTTTQLALVPSDTPGEEISLTVAKSGVENPWTIEFSEGQWKTDLEAGDHVVHIALPTGQWFGGTVSFDLTEDAMVVIHRHPDHITTAWTTTSGTVGGGDDPKDPWPPPGGNETLANATWMVTKLHDVALTISNPRDAPPPPEE